MGSLHAVTPMRLMWFALQCFPLKQAETECLLHFPDVSGMLFGAFVSCFDFRKWGAIKP